jgi:hypothetical protein
VAESSFSIDEFQYNFIKSFDKYKSENEFYASVSTSLGEVELLSEIEIPDEETLHIKELAIFPKDKKAFEKGKLTKEFSRLRKHLCTAAYRLGFRFLRISFIRIGAGSSAKPGSRSDLTVDLKKYAGRKHG